MANIKTYCRIKPTTGCLVEYACKGHMFELMTRQKSAGNLDKARKNKALRHQFQFDQIFIDNALQQDIFNCVARDIIYGFLRGYNGTVFAYGPTGTGKTFTMEGISSSQTEKGLAPRSLSMIFRHLRDNECQVKVSYLEIYQETGYDLLGRATRTNPATCSFPKVAVLEGAGDACIIRNLTVHVVETEEAAQTLLRMGQANRTISETPLNNRSSRSHAIFSVYMTRTSRHSGKLIRSKLHLVDLAGSERIGKSDNSSLTTEARYINLSLYHLEGVILALQKDANCEENSRQKTKGQSRSSTGKPGATNLAPYIPYRNSLLTMVLRDSLGGNCQTAMIATITLAANDFGEILSTCRFAQRVANVSNILIKNEEASNDPSAALHERIRELERQLSEMTLRTSKDCVTSRKLSRKEKHQCLMLVHDYVTGRISDPLMAAIGLDVNKCQECFRIMKGLMVESYGKTCLVQLSAEDMDNTPDFSSFPESLDESDEAIESSSWTACPDDSDLPRITSSDLDKLDVGARLAYAKKSKRYQPLTCIKRLTEQNDEAMEGRTDAVELTPTLLNSLRDEEQDTYLNILFETRQMQLLRGQIKLQLSGIAEYLLKQKNFLEGIDQPDMSHDIIVRELKVVQDLREQKNSLAQEMEAVNRQLEVLRNEEVKLTQAVQKRSQMEQRKEANVLSQVFKYQRDLSNAKSVNYTFEMNNLDDITFRHQIQDQIVLTQKKLDVYRAQLLNSKSNSVPQPSDTTDISTSDSSRQPRASIQSSVSSLITLYKEMDVIGSEDPFLAKYLPYKQSSRTAWHLEDIRGLVKEYLPMIPSTSSSMSSQATAAVDRQSRHHKEAAEANYNGQVGKNKYVQATALSPPKKGTQERVMSEKSHGKWAEPERSEHRPVVTFIEPRRFQGFSKLQMDKVQDEPVASTSKMANWEASRMLQSEVMKKHPSISRAIREHSYNAFQERPVVGHRLANFEPNSNIENRESASNRGVVSAMKSPHSFCLSTCARLPPQQMHQPPAMFGCDAHGNTVETPIPYNKGCGSSHCGPHQVALPRNAHNQQLMNDKVYNASHSPVLEQCRQDINRLTTPSSANAKDEQQFTENKAVPVSIATSASRPPPRNAMNVRLSGDDSDMNSRMNAPGVRKPSVQRAGETMQHGKHLVAYDEMEASVRNASKSTAEYALETVHLEDEDSDGSTCVGLSQNRDDVSTESDRYTQTTVAELVAGVDSAAVGRACPGESQLQHCDPQLTATNETGAPSVAPPGPPAENELTLAPPNTAKMKKFRSRMCYLEVLAGLQDQEDTCDDDNHGDPDEQITQAKPAEPTPPPATASVSSDKWLATEVKKTSNAYKGLNVCGSGSDASVEPSPVTSVTNYTRSAEDSRVLGTPMKPIATEPLLRAKYLEASVNTAVAFNATSSGIAAETTPTSVLLKAHYTPATNVEVYKIPSEHACRTTLRAPSPPRRIVQTKAQSEGCVMFGGSKQRSSSRFRDLTTQTTNDLRQLCCKCTTANLAPIRPKPRCGDKTTQTSNTWISSSGATSDEMSDVAKYLPLYKTSFATQSSGVVATPAEVRSSQKLLDLNKPVAESSSEEFFCPSRRQLEMKKGPNYYTSKELASSDSDTNVYHGKFERKLQEMLRRAAPPKDTQEKSKTLERRGGGGGGGGGMAATSVKKSSSELAGEVASTSTTNWTGYSKIADTYEQGTLGQEADKLKGVRRALPLFPAHGYKPAGCARTEFERACEAFLAKDSPFPESAVTPSTSQQKETKKKSTQHSDRLDETAKK